MNFITSYLENEKWVARALLLVGGGVVLGALIRTTGNTEAWLVPAAATLAGAFLGSWSAFRLQVRSKMIEERSHRVAECNRAIFTIYKQLNTLSILQQDFVNPYRDRPLRHIEIPPVPSVQEPEHKIDFDALAFLLQTDESQLLFDLFIEDARYREVMKLIKFRSDIHFYQYQPLLEKAGAKVGEEYTAAEIRTAVGDYIYRHLENATALMIKHIDRSVKTLEETKDKLTSSARKLFPGEKFIKVVRIEKDVHNEDHR